MYRQAVQSNPRWNEGWWFLGTLLYDSDQYADARDALSKFVELEPKPGPAWGLLGLSEFETGDYASALKHIEQALASDNGDPAQMQVVLRYHEALLLTRLGQFDAAMQKYAAFTQNGAPPNPSLVSGIGLAALRVPLVPKEIPAEQRDLYVTAGKAAYFIMARDYPKAGASFQELLDRFSTAPGVHYLYGCYLLASAPDHAMAELKRELEIAPSNAAADAMLAWSLLNQHDARSALPYAQRAVKGAPSFPTAQYVLGRALAETGDVAAGIGYLEAAEKLDPMNLEDHLALASAYSKAGRTDDARRERSQSVALAKGEPVAQR